jgi:hypothetical protein
MNSEELKKRTKAFAHRCVKLAMALPETALGKHLSGTGYQVFNVRCCQLSRDLPFAIKG